MKHAAEPSINQGSDLLDRSEPNPVGARTRRRTSTESRAPAAAVPANRTGLECNRSGPAHRRAHPGRRGAFECDTSGRAARGSACPQASRLVTGEQAAANPVASMPSAPCTTNPGHRACRPAMRATNPTTADGVRGSAFRDRLEPDTRQTADAGAVRRRSRRACGARHPEIDWNPADGRRRGGPPTLTGRTDRTADGDTPTRTRGNGIASPPRDPPPRDPTPVRRSDRGSPPRQDRRHPGST